MPASADSTGHEPSTERESGADQGIEAALEGGFAHHQAGRLDDAERVYRCVLDADPEHPLALHLLALVANQRGQHELAVALIGRSLARDPEYPAPYYDLGNILRDLGRADEAERAFARAVALWPEWPEAQFNLGLLLEARGALNDAAVAYRAAVAAKPDYARALVCLATVLRKEGRKPEAEAALRSVQDIEPRSADGHYLRGKALSDLGQHEAALRSFDAAIALNPDYADAHIERGNSLYELMRHEAALESFDRAVALAPAAPVAHLNRGTALVALHRHEDAVASYEQAIAVGPGSVAAWYSRGNALADLKRYAAAMASYERAIALDPEYAVAHYLLGECRLRLGDFARGWEGMEWRLQAEGFEEWNPKAFAQPRWLGAESLEGRTILLQAEGGMGDTLQFCRYVKHVAARGATVVLQVQPPLLRLLAHLEGATRVVPTGAPLPPFDCHGLLMSLPHVLSATLKGIPAEIPYVHADPGDLQRWKTRVAGEPGLKVGLVWSGDPRKHNSDAYRSDKVRSMSLAQFAPLAQVNGVRFFSLQKGAPALQAKNPPAGMALADYTDELVDFADTAALVSQLDLVISVDTSTAHLAGALGVPVWMLSRYNGCWRWLLDREDSPWYPSMRIFRQTRWGDWHEVMERVVTALMDRASAASSEWRARQESNL